MLSFMLVLGLFLNCAKESHLDLLVAFVFETIFHASSVGLKFALESRIDLDLLKFLPQTPRHWAERHKPHLAADLVQRIN